MITNKNYNLNLAEFSDKKLMYGFVKAMNYDERALGNKRTGDKSCRRLLKSPAIIASGFSTIILPQNPNELWDRLKVLPQEKQAGNCSDIFSEKLIAKADKLFEYKCISEKQHSFLLYNFLKLNENNEVDRKSWNVIRYYVCPQRYVQYILLIVKCILIYLEKIVLIFC